MINDDINKMDTIKAPATKLTIEFKGLKILLDDYDVNFIVESGFATSEIKDKIANIVVGLICKGSYDISLMQWFSNEEINLIASTGTMKEETKAKLVEEITSLIIVAEYDILDFFQQVF